MYPDITVIATLIDGDIIPVALLVGVCQILDSCLYRIRECSFMQA
jgi:hypothetical protein